MEYKNPLTVSLERSFIAGTGDLAAFHNRLNKLDCAVILFCRSGWAQITIDLRKYEIVKNTQVVLLPGRKKQRLQPFFFRFLWRNVSGSLSATRPALLSLPERESLLYAPRRCNQRYKRTYGCYFCDLHRLRKPLS